MICIRCGTRGRASHSGSSAPTHCPECGLEVVFFPSAGDPLSDRLFSRMIDRASADGNLRFTVGHLYYELRRALGPIEREHFELLWTRWQAVHGKPEALVTPWPLRSMAPDLREADIGDYSFERVVITDSAWMVDFLLWNNFHFETNSAVLCIEGYPNDRFEMIRGMLHKNPQIIVIALHDASVEGCAMAQRLVSEPDWFSNHGYVIDVGLGPAHRKLYGELWQTRDTPVEAHDPNDPDAVWLSRHRLDLAVVRPEKTMRRLFRATRRFAALVGTAKGPRVGEVFRDNDLLGPGKHKRIAAGEVLE